MAELYCYIRFKENVFVGVSVMLSCSVVEGIVSQPVFLDDVPFTRQIFLRRKKEMTCTDTSPSLATAGGTARLMESLQ